MIKRTMLAVGFAATAMSLTACAGGRFMTIEPRKQYSLTGQDEVARPKQPIGWSRVKPAQYQPPGT